MNKVLSTSCAFVISYCVFGDALVANETAELLGEKFYPTHPVIIQGKPTKVTNLDEIIGVPNLRKRDIDGTGTKAIIIDTHLKPDHQELKNLTKSSIPGQYIPEVMVKGHGTHVTAIIGKKCGNSAWCKIKISHDS